MRVLVIDDDAELAETVAVGLRREPMAVDVAVDGPSGLERALDTDYDVIVLDRDLPGVHGDEVCAELIAAGRRSWIIMLTAASRHSSTASSLVVSSRRRPARTATRRAGSRLRSPCSRLAGSGAAARRPRARMRATSSAKSNGLGR